MLSDSIITESTEALVELGQSVVDATAFLNTVSAHAEIVDLGTDSPGLLGVVRDPDDVHVLRCALGIFETRADLVDATRFLVSDNTHHFRPGLNFYGFEFITAYQFWRRLQQAK